MKYKHTMKKQNVTILISILFCLIFIQTTSALLGTFQKEADIDLVQTCNNCTYCNITSVKYPNGTNILTNKEMNKDGTYYNYVLGGTNITEVGTYTYYYDCGNSVEKATGGIDFKITITGDETPEGTSYILAGMFIIIFGISWFFIFLSIKMNEPGPKIFFLLASFVFLIGSLLLAMVVGFDSNLTEGVNNTMRILMYALGLIFFVVFAYVMIKQIVAAMDLLQQKKGYEIGWD